MTNPTQFPRSTLALALTLALAGGLTGCETAKTDAELVSSAKDAYDKHDLKASVISLKNALEKNPENAEARRLLGEISVELGNGAAAEKELRKAMELGVARQAVLLALAKALSQQNKNQDLLDQIELPEDLGSEVLSELKALRGDAWLALGKLDKSREEYAASIARKPKSAPARLGLARLALIDNDPTKALNLAQEILHDEPANAKAWMLQAELEKGKGDNDKAFASFSRVVEIDERNLAARANRALLAIDLGKSELADEDLAYLKKNAPSFFLTSFVSGVQQFNRKKYPEAQADLEQAIKLNPSYAATHYYLGAVHAMVEHYAQAEEFLSRFQSAFPNSAQARRMLAWVKLKNGDAQAAKALIKPVVDGLPNDTFALNLLGNIEAALGNREQSVELLRKVAELNPSSPEAKYQLGAQLLASGQKELAMNILQEASEMGEKLWQPDLTLAMARIDGKKFDEAIAGLEELKKKMPGSTTPENLVGLVYARKGDLEKAKSIWREILSKSPGDLSASGNLAALALNDNKPDEARKLYETALREHPKHIETRLKLAELDLAENKFKEAEERLSSLVKEEPKFLPARLALAAYYVRYGQAKRAQTLIEEARSTAPDSPELLATLVEAQLQDNQESKALDSAKLLVGVAAKSARAQYLAARAFAANSDLGSMRKHLDESLALDPKFFPSRVAKVRLLALEKKFADAKQYLELLRSEFPENPQVLDLQGWFATQDARPADAVKAYQAAQEKYPSTEFVTSLAKALWATGDTDGSLKTLDSWNRAHPDDYWVMFLRSGLYGATGKVEEAKRTLESLIALQPKNPMALNELAWLLRTAEPAKALEFAEKAYEYDSSNPQIMDTLAMVLIENKRLERALIIAKQALDQQPKNPSFIFHLALAQNANGQTEAAAKTLKALLSSHKAFPERGEAETLFSRLTK